MLPGTEGDSDNQNVPPSNSSTFLIEERDSEAEKPHQFIRLELKHMLNQRENDLIPSPCHNRLCSVHLNRRGILFLKFQIGHSLQNI